MLASAYRADDIAAVDALRIMRHELRRRNTNKTLHLQLRSEGAQEAIDRYSGLGLSVPKNGSNDSLHADHVYALTEEHLKRLLTVEDWLAELPRLREVVCVTAAENYLLEQLERAGHQGPEKYKLAGIRWAERGSDLSL